MSRKKIYESIRKSLKKAVIGIDIDTINEETDLLENEVLDSLDSMVFFMELQEAENIEFPEDDLIDNDLFKINKLIDYIIKYHAN